MPKNYENAWQLVTDCHRFKVGDELSPSLQKKEALSGLEKGLVLATCHIMTNEEDCSALAYRGTILDTCTKIAFCDMLVRLLVRTYVYMCAQKETGYKGTKKIPYTQIYMGNSFKNVDFVAKIGDYSM